MMGKKSGVRAASTRDYEQRIRLKVELRTEGLPTTTDQRYFVYDGDQMVLVMDPNGAVQNRYLWGAAVDEILADEQVGGELLWTLTDNLGTVRELVNNTSTVRNHIVYDTYGNVLSETAGGARSAIKFTGRYLDTETGLQWNLNRWYDAKTGRWLSQDPIGFEGGDANLYRYVGNDPGNGVDPSGLAEYHLPDKTKGTWVYGTEGNGVFVYSSDPLRPLVYVDQMPEFDSRNLYPTPDGAAPRASIQMDTSRGKSRLGRTIEDMKRADAKMRERYGQDWRRPDGYTWHHKSLSGTECEMELVETDAHRRYPHKGPRSWLDERLGLPFRKPKAQKNRGGFLDLRGLSPSTATRDGSTQGLSRLSPRARGTISGAGPVLGPLAAELAVGYLDALSGGSLSNFLDNTMGTNPGHMWQNITDLCGSDASRHWRHILDKKQPDGRYRQDALAQEIENRIREAIEEYERRSRY